MTSNKILRQHSTAVKKSRENIQQSNNSQVSTRRLYYKFFIAVMYGFRNKLECLSLASLSSLVWCLRVMPEPTQVKHLQVLHS